MSDEQKTNLQARSALDLISREQLSHPENFRRAYAIEEAAVDVQRRTVALSFSSEFPVLRTDARGQPFYEVLDHSAADLSRLHDGAPLLYGHERSQHIGIVEKAAIGPDKKGRAIVRFSRSKFAEEKFVDVQDKILVKSSLGYDLANAEYVVEGDREGTPVFRFYNWQATEVSLVPLPADNSVGVGRESPSNSGASVLSVRHQPNFSMSSNSNDAREIVEIADVLKGRHSEKRDEIDRAMSQHISEGRSANDFNRYIINNVLATRESATPYRQDANAGFVGLNRKDLSRFSILRAINSVIENKSLTGLERECNDELVRKLGRAPKGFFIPDEIAADRRSLHRTLTAGIPADGGYNIASNILPNELVELARNEARVIELGARMISGLVGDISVPRQLTGATAYWVSETGSIGQSNATFGQIIGKPRRLGTSVPYSKQFLAQTSLDAEAFVIADSDRSIATELDRVAINGKGGAEPIGILNLASGDRSTSVTFGGAATFAKLTEFEANVGGNNTLSGRPAYLTTWASKAKWKTIQRFTNAGVGLWNTDEDVAGYRGRTTAQFPSSPTANQAIFGDFTQLLYLEWAGRDVVVDPYTGKKEGTVEVTIQRLVDMIVRQGKAFAISSDTGAA